MQFCIFILFQILIIYNYILIFGILLSWIPYLYNFRIFRIIRKICDWYMEPFQGYVVIGPIDFTPLIGFMIYDAILYGISYLL